MRQKVNSAVQEVLRYIATQRRLFSLNVRFPAGCPQVLVISQLWQDSGDQYWGLVTAFGC
jgi:hypothetical protein